MQAAYRYAETFFLAMQEKNLLDQAVRDATIVRALAETDARFNQILSSEVLATERKLAIFHKLFSTTLHRETHKFLRFMLHKKRSALIAVMATSFLDLYNKRQGTLNAEVVTAYPLSDEILATLNKKFTAATAKTPATSSQKKLSITARVDKTLLTGFTLCVENKLYDYSLRGKLTRLKTYLSQS
ncbi:ATP synthase subunit delta [Spirochaetota bacterium]|nr:ATP synthase subunit delta [Spirochaetota bacterium]